MESSCSFHTPMFCPRGPKRGAVAWKTGNIDIDLVFAPYCHQEAIFVPNSPGGAPKLDPTLLTVSADFALFFYPRSDCHRSDCPRSTPTTPSALPRCSMKIPWSISHRIPLSHHVYFPVEIPRMGYETGTAALQDRRPVYWKLESIQSRSH